MFLRIAAEYINDGRHEGLYIPIELAPFIHPPSRCLRHHTGLYSVDMREDEQTHQRNLSRLKTENTRPKTV